MVLTSFFFIFISSFFILVNENNHVIIIILSLEMMTVSLYGMLSTYCLTMFCMVFLSLAVCEAVLGLSVLVSLVRGFGSANVSGLFLLNF